MHRAVKGMFARSKPGYFWEDHRGLGNNTPGEGLLFYVPVGHDKASVATIAIDDGAINAVVVAPKHARRRCRTLTAAKRWVERTAR